jgi:hypothetical protein
VTAWSWSWGWDEVEGLLWVAGTYRFQWGQWFPIAFPAISVMNNQPIKRNLLKEDDENTHLQSSTPGTSTFNHFHMKAF